MYEKWIKVLCIYKVWCVLCSDRLSGQYILKRYMTWELLLIHSLLFPDSLVRMFTAYMCVFYLFLYVCTSL